MAEDFLRPAEVLDQRSLVAPAVRGGPAMRIGVACGRPLLYPVPPSALPPVLRARSAATGSRYAGAVFTFDLDEAPHGYRYTGARFTAELADERAIAIVVHGDGGQFGLTADDASAPLAAAARDGAGHLIRRLGLRVDRPSARTTGTQSHRFGWAYTGRRSAPILPRTYGVHALLEIPAGITVLTGTLAAEVDVTGLARRRASLAERVPFTVAVAAATGRAAAVRLCMAADIEGYSRHGDVAHERLQRDLVAVLAAARGTAGIGAEAVNPQPRGDGQFTVLPAGIDESAVIPDLVRGLAAALATRDAGGAREPMRLRFALHRGLVKEADNGWVGRAAVAVHRILDSPAVRTALSGNPAAGFVLGVPDVLYRDVIAGSEHPPGPDAFAPVTVDLPAKGFVEQAWLYVPEESPA